MCKCVHMWCTTVQARYTHGTKFIYKNQHMSSSIQCFSAFAMRCFWSAFAIRSPVSVASVFGRLSSPPSGESDAGTCKTSVGRATVGDTPNKDMPKI